MNITTNFLESFPGFLSIRNSKHEIIYINENFRNWIKLFTDVEPLGKTNDCLSQLVEANVAEVFKQCHDASIDWLENHGSNNCLKRIIPFKDTNNKQQYFEVIKYSQLINNENHIFTVCFDISELYLENQKNLSLSVLDPLTKSYNRNFLYQQNKDFFSDKIFVYIDLDNFKNINDIFGHNIGDVVLNDFVEFIRNNIKFSDIIIRLGGDEFLVLVNNRSLSEVEERIYHLKKEFIKEFNKYPCLSFSYGISNFKNTLEETLNFADSSMYKYKVLKEKNCIMELKEHI